MDYKKKYKEALELMKDCIPDKDGLVHIRPCEIFPELKKSEDERIRKELKSFFDSEMSDYGNVEWRKGIRYGEIVAWIEKQGEQKPQGKLALEVWKDMRLEVYQQASGNRHEPNYSDDSTKMFSLTDIDEIFEKVAEKQCEQKTTNKIKPRFKVGDTIRPKGSMAEYTIESIYGECYHGKGWVLTIGCDEDYELVEQKPADKIEPKFHAGDFITDGERIFQIKETVWERNNRNDGTTYCESLIVNLRDGITYANNTDLKEYHLWTIQDAKRGDILYEQETKSILLVHERSGNWLQTHCDYWMVKEKFHVGFPYENYGFVQQMSFEPATKEQRGLLFQKMKEEGYEWDEDKKELKKFHVIDEGGKK